MILINRSLLALIVLCLMVSINSFATPSSSAIPIKRVIVFGDSLSDDGNDYLTLQPVRAMIGRITALHNTFPTDLVPSAYHEPYFDGRFSNGPVWVEQLAHLFGIMDTNNHRAGHFQFIDFAYGGALARGNSLASDVFPMPLNEQVADYLLHSITYVNKDKTLAVLLIGANDYLDNTKKSFDPKDVTPVIDAQLSAIKTVYHSGVHHFLIANLPRLDLTPLAKVRGNAYQQKERALVSASNQALKTALDQLSADKHYKDIHITYYDLSEVHSMLDSRLTEFGYGDPSLARTPCYPMYPVPNLVSTYVHLNQHQSLIANEDKHQNESPGTHYPVYFDNRCADKTNLNQHVYFDDVHPSAKLHCMMALTACYALMQQGYQRVSLIHSHSVKPLNCHVSGNIEQQLQMAASYCLAHRVLLPETT